MSGLLNLYHRLPPAARDWAASLRGWYLQRWRYGAETDDWVAAALARETWTAVQWQTYQEDQLARLLHRAATQVPYYRQQWAERRRRGDRASQEVLANWAILEKDALRQHPQAFLAENSNPRKMFHEHTSGTTGKPLDLWWSRTTTQVWYALFEARWRRWYGISRQDRWAILGGQVIIPTQQRQPPFWVWNAPMRQLYLSTYHLAPDLIPAYLDAMEKYGVRYLYCYPSAAYALAQAALRHNRSLPLAVVITNAEPLLAHQRETIAAVFQCPVRETYGMSEIVSAASECEHGSLHLWADAGITEFIEGEIIGTGLLNQDMPLIRYRTGDRGTAGANERCACGRTLPLLAGIEGRSDDLLITRDGRQIGRLDSIFKSSLPVYEAQLIQETLDTIRVKIVPAPQWTDAAAQDLTGRIQERLGAVNIIIEQVEVIPRSANGKFRAVISRLH